MKRRGIILILIVVTTMLWLIQLSAAIAAPTLQGQDLAVITEPANNASIASTISMAGMSVYSASKHAVVGMTKAAALELGPQNIRVNAVSPAAVRTEMYDRFTGGDKSVQDQMGAMHPIGRSALPEEIASVVTFLCSDAASFVTGSNYMVDGGFTAQ